MDAQVGHAATTKKAKVAAGTGVITWPVQRWVEVHAKRVGSVADLSSYHTLYVLCVASGPVVRHLHMPWPAISHSHRTRYTVVTPCVSVIHVLSLVLLLSRSGPRRKTCLPGACHEYVNMYPRSVLGTDTERAGKNAIDRK